MSKRNSNMQIIEKIEKFLLGKHNEIPDSSFDTKELEIGIKLEMEHTDDKDIAKAIAKDHLSEFPNYYTTLEKMEDSLKRGKE